MIRPWPKVSAAFFDKNATVNEINQFGNIICLKQTHSSSVVNVDENFLKTSLKANPTRQDILSCEGDALVTKLDLIPLAIRTADCLPLLGFTKDAVGACHAGWRGLGAGIIENWLDQLGKNKNEIQIAVGPSIGVCHFEVHKDVRETIFNGAKLTIEQRKLCEGKHSDPQKSFIDLPRIALICLERKGIAKKNISVIKECTFCDEQKYFSYRRDGKRIGSLYAVIAKG
jgi:YfiH family protein